MARFVHSMNVSLDGYVDHDRFAPSPILFRHFIEAVKGFAGSLYGRRTYEIMRYWDDDQPDWGEDERAFAAAWRTQPKWVISRTLTEVGPNATLLHGNALDAARTLKAEVEGDIDVEGPVLAGALSELIDEYGLYFHPVVLGHGKPFFTAERPPLKLVGSETIDGIMRLRYVPA